MNSLIKSIEVAAPSDRSSVEVLVLFASVSMILFRQTVLGGAVIAIAIRVVHTFVPSAPWFGDLEFSVALRPELSMGRTSALAANSSIGWGEMRWT